MTSCTLASQAATTELSAYVISVARGPETFASVVSAILYEKGFGPYFYVPVIAGLKDDGTPAICTFDLIGSEQLAKDFLVSGTASEWLCGACESMYKPDLGPEELFEVRGDIASTSVVSGLHQWMGWHCPRRNIRPIDHQDLEGPFGLIELIEEHRKYPYPVVDRRHGSLSTRKELLNVQQENC